MNLLSARDLAKSYGERSLFTNVGFTIEEGEKVGLVGVNGCGKTTLFRIIAGMERADSGTVSVNRLTTIGYMEQHGFDAVSYTHLTETSSSTSFSGEISRATPSRMTRALGAEIRDSSSTIFLLRTSCTIPITILLMMLQR